MFNNVLEFDAAQQKLGDEYEALIDAATTDAEKERLKQEFRVKDKALNLEWMKS